MPFAALILFDAQLNLIQLPCIKVTLPSANFRSNCRFALCKLPGKPYFE